MFQGLTSQNFYKDDAFLSKTGRQLRVRKGNYFSYFSIKTYVVGTQKNRLTETVLLNTQNMFKLMDRKLISILHRNFLLNWPYALKIVFASS